MTSLDVHQCYVRATVGIGADGRLLHAGAAAGAWRNPAVAERIRELALGYITPETDIGPQDDEMRKLVEKYRAGAGGAPAGAGPAEAEPGHRAGPAQAQQPAQPAQPATGAISKPRPDRNTRRRRTMAMSWSTGNRTELGTGRRLGPRWRDAGRRRGGGGMTRLLSKGQADLLRLLGPNALPGPAGNGRPGRPGPGAASTSRRPGWRTPDSIDSVPHGTPLLAPHPPLLPHPNRA